MSSDGLDRFEDGLDEHLADALFLASEHLRGAMIPRTPLRDGDLRRSARTEHTAEEAVLVVDTPYAAAQHENLGWKHPKAGEAQFLLRAAEAEATAIGEIIADRLRRAGRP